MPLQVVLEGAYSRQLRVVSVLHGPQLTTTDCGTPLFCCAGQQVVPTRTLASGFRYKYVDLSAALRDIIRRTG
jgi:hypothetical protein